MKNKILFIINHLTRVAPMTVTFNIIKFLKDSDFEPLVLTLYPERKDTCIDLFKQINVPVYSLNIKSIKDYIFLPLNLKRIVKKINPKLIHVQLFISSFWSILCLDKEKLLTTLHCDYDQDFKMVHGIIKGWVISRLMDFSVARIPNRYACSEALSEILNNKKSYNVDFINNGIDNERFKPITNKDDIRSELNLPTDKKIFIWSALHLPRKNPFVLTNAIKKANSNEFFIICGDGPLTSSIQQELKDCNNVLMTGNVKNVEQYLQASDYYISTSLSEGLPLSVLEGMACGLPVILSDIPQHSILFNYQVDIGYKFNPHNVDELQNCILNIQNKDYQRLSSNCYHLVEENFTAKIMSQKYKNEYQNLIGDFNE